MKKLLILDPGHGINTPGKRGPVWFNNTQAIEWSLNRELVNKIKNKIESDCTLNSNIEVVVTNPGDIEIPLPKRSKFVNDLITSKNLKSSDCLLISIHFNAAQSRFATGWEAWISKSASQRSKNFVNILYDKAEQGLNKDLSIRNYSPNQKYWTANFWIVTKTICPAVLSENGFMTNYADTQFIISESGQNKLADIHVKAIRDYFLL